MSWTRICAVCGTGLNPFHENTMTAHEYECYKRTGKIPPEHQKPFSEVLKWEARSVRAKAAARKRKGKRRAAMALRYRLATVEMED